MDNQDTIINSIDRQAIITFHYNDCRRRVEPHLLGLSTNNELTLCAWQIAGTGEGWRDFHVSKMADIQVTEESFAGAREGYNPHDSTMSRVLCQLSSASGGDTNSQQQGEPPHMTMSSLAQ